MSLDKNNPIFRSVSSWLNRNFSSPEALGLFFTVLFGFLMLEFFGGFLTPVIMSIIFAYLLKSPVDWLVKCRCPRIIAVLIVYLLFLSVFTLIFLVFLPSLWRQTYLLVSQIPQVFSQAQVWLDAIQQKHPSYFSEAQVAQLISDLRNQATRAGQWLLSQSITSLPNVIEILVYLILVPLLLFFFMKDRDQLINWFRQYMPKHPGLVLRVWSEFNVKMAAYVRGRVIEILLVFVVLWIVYSLFGLPYAFSLAAAFAISQLIPIIGGVVVTIPITIIALMHWGMTPVFWGFMVVHFVIYALDGNVLVPLLFAEFMDLHPVVIILAVMFFAAIWGIWGAFFSIPLATLIDIILRKWPRTQAVIK